MRAPEAEAPNDLIALRAGAPDEETRTLLRRLDALIADDAASGYSDWADVRASASRIFAAFAGDGDPSGRVTSSQLRVAGVEGPLEARLYRRSDRDGAPLIVFFHGGGWSVGALDDYDELLSALSGMSGAAIASIAYRLAPEHLFPAAHEDAVAATIDLAARARAMSLDGARIAIMGDSAGGNLAAATALALRGETPTLSAQFLLYPMLDVARPHAAFPSRLRYGAGGHFLTCANIEASAALYLGAAVGSDPRVSPLLAKDLSGAPQAYIMTPGCDPLRDEAVAYAARLRAAGVTARLDVEPGAIHAFLSFGVLKSSGLARRRLADAISALLGTDGG